MDVVDSDEDGLNNDGEDIDPGQTKGGSVTASDGENLSDKEQEDIKTLDSWAVRVRFAEEVCVGYNWCGLLYLIVSQGCRLGHA